MPVKRFSTGMVSRLSFAIAMQFPADIYVFDEVLAVVDGDFQARCLAEIAGLHAAGRTVIFVSHSLHQVAQVCERAAVMYAGEIAEIGPTDALYHSPRHPYTRLLFAATPDLYGEGGPVVSIPGAPPRLDRPITGCPFQPRCDRAFAPCPTIHPELKTVAPGQDAACHLNDVAQAVPA